MVSFPISCSPFKLVALIVPQLVQGRSVLLPRTASTNATCGSQFLWMENSEGQSPCLVASILSSACSTGKWNVPPVNSSQEYIPPSPGYVNYCSCSWAVYNLLEACTACQANDNILRWDPYIINCESYLTKTAFPTEKIMPHDNTLIPYWSAVNPATWLNGQFNVIQAQALQSYSDINLSNLTPTTKKSTISVGIITGGVVEGIIGAVLITIAVPILCLRCYRRRTSARMTTPECIRLVSNTWQQATGPATLIDTRQNPTPSTVYSPISLSSPFIQTSHLYPSPQSSVVEMSAQPVANAAAMRNPEDVISRFNLTSTQREIYPIYEESWPSPTVSTTSGRRPTYIESQVNHGNWEPALISSHSPAAHLVQVDRMGRVHRPQIAVDSMDWTITPGNRDGITNSDTTSLRKQENTSNLGEPTMIRPDSGHSGTYLSARSSFSA